MSKEKGQLKSKEAYKRAKNILVIATIAFSLLIVGGIGAGIYSATNTSKTLRKYIESPEYLTVHVQDLQEVDEEYKNGEISYIEKVKKQRYMSSSNYAYVEKSLERSDSELKKENNMNNMILVSGIGAAVCGAFAGISCAIAACKKDDKYQEKLEEEKS